jgi:DNA-binding Lrp family transcriptional regulator
MEENHQISQLEIAKKMNLNKATVFRNIKQLTEKGNIRRVGARKNGYWQIIKPTNRNS